MRLLFLWLCLISHGAFCARFYINPDKGNDTHTGKSVQQAWKSFTPANQHTFKPGDEIFIYPGKFDTSLQLNAQGSATKPVIVYFTAGKYNFYDTHAYRTKLAITNTNDVPDGLKAIAIYIKNSQHVKVTGNNTQLVMHAKMIETCIDNSSNIAINGMSYDYATPTVSEFTVSALTNNTADLSINPSSPFFIKDSALYWKGEGWQYKNSWYWQEFNSADGFVTRTGLSFNNSSFKKIDSNTVRVHFATNPGLKNGYTYQTRDVTRDCAGFFFRRSKNIKINNIRVFFMHGMGVVSQFCQNISINKLIVKPADGRTCAAWADILHFAGCKGLIEVKNSYLSAANDDAINVHGIHLRIIEQTAPNQFKLRFMHGQTYGFEPYLPGDSIELIHGNSLLPFAANTVKMAQMLNDKDVLLTLTKPFNGPLVNDDAVENITWTPRVNVNNTVITSIPTRGILTTTRRPVLIQKNTFKRLAGPAILVANDAESWYESGPVKNLKILNNNFIYCGQPVIDIHPENTRFDGPVHQNIMLKNNRFSINPQVVISAKSTNNLTIEHNTIKLAQGIDSTSLFRFEHSSNIKTTANHIIN